MVTDRAWPSVAVVVPNHQRVEETLLAVRSAMDQEYPGRLHVYLVYERRPDAAALLESLPSGVVAIGLASPADANPIAAKRNAALAACDEDLVGFLDDDDLWHRQKIRRQVEAMRAVPGAVACSTGYLTFSDGVHWGGLGEGLGDRLPALVSRSAVLRASTIVTSSVLAHGPTVRELRFDERPDWLAVEDFHLWNRLRAGAPIVHVPTPLVAIRVRSSSMSQQSRSLQCVKGLDVLAELAAAGRDWDIAQAAALAAMRAALSARGTVDPRSDALLGHVFDGRLFGSFDPAVAGAIRFVWRSRRLVPALYAARDRLARLHQDLGASVSRGSGTSPR